MYYEGNFNKEISAFSDLPNKDIENDQIEEDQEFQSVKSSSRSSSHSGYVEEKSSKNKNEYSVLKKEED